MWYRRQKYFNWVSSPVQARQRGAAGLNGTDASRHIGQEGDVAILARSSSSARGQAGSIQQQAHLVTYTQMEYLRELLSLGSLTEEVQQEIMLQVRTRAQANWVISQCLAGQM